MPTKVITVDFSQVEAPEPIANGTYPAIVQQVEQRQAEDGEYPYFAWEFQVSEGAAEGRSLYLNTSLSPKALWRLQALVENLGVYQQEMEFEVDEDSNLLISPNVVGLPCNLVVKNEMYRGRLQPRVEDVLPMSKGPTIKIAKPTAQTKAKEPTPAPAPEGGEPTKKKPAITMKLR